MRACKPCWQANECAAPSNRISARSKRRHGAGRDKIEKMAAYFDIGMLVNIIRVDEETSCYLLLCRSQYRSVILFWKKSITKKSITMKKEYHAAGVSDKIGSPDQIFIPALAWPGHQVRGMCRLPSHSVQDLRVLWLCLRHTICVRDL
eukprot:COSAG02_NODE_162_length_32474_cov_13.222511_14_plen_148_part_00